MLCGALYIIILSGQENPCPILILYKKDIYYSNLLLETSLLTVTLAMYKVYFLQHCFERFMSGHMLL